MRLIFWLFTTLFLVATPATASEIEVAKRYIQALENGSADEIDHLVADNIVYEDVTWGVTVEGKAAVSEVYKTYTVGSHIIDHEVERAYVFRGTVVIRSLVRGSVALVPGSNSDQRITVAIEVVRVITLKDGKVVRHIDLADYQSMNDQTEIARKQKGL